MPSECLYCPYAQRLIFKEQMHTKTAQMLGYPPNEAFVLVSLFLVENTQVPLAGIPVFLANRAESLR